MPAYKVTGMGWFVVEVPTKRNAYSEGVEDWGRGGVDNVERATQQDIDYFKALKGEDALRPFNDYPEVRRTRCQPKTAQ